MGRATDGTWRLRSGAWATNAPIARAEAASIICTRSWRPLLLVLSADDSALRWFLRSGISGWFGGDARGGEALSLTQPTSPHRHQALAP